MGNEWNNFADALMNAGANVGKGMIIGGIRKDAANTYKKTMKNIDKIISMSPTGQETDVMTQEQPTEGTELNQFFDGFSGDKSLSENIGGMQPVGSEEMNRGPVIQPRTVQQPNISADPQGEMLKVFLDGVAKLNTYGEYGADYIDPLKTFYESKQPKAPKTYRDVIDGNIVITDESGKVLRKTKVSEEKKKEFKIESDWQIKDNGDGTYSYYEPTETGWIRTKLDASQRDFDMQEKQGEFGKQLSKRPGGGFKGGKLNIPISDKGSDDNKKFDALAEFNNKINAGSELSMEEEDKYNTLRLDLGKRYNMDDNQLAKVIDRLESSTSENDRKKIINEIEKGEYYEDVGTSQEQMEYDANRILEWQDVLDKSYSANDGTYDGYKQAFLKELQDFYFRGSITSKEYATLKQMYF